MTSDQKRDIRLLQGVTFLPASWDKRFARNLALRLETFPDKPLTANQVQWLDTLVHRYRRQHKNCRCLQCLKAVTPNPHDRSMFPEGEAG